jgi:hypothetical protein
MNDNELEKQIAAKIILYKEVNVNGVRTLREIMQLITAERAKWELEARIVIGLFGEPRCEQLHHDKKYQHTATEDCPVEALINQLNNLKEK